MGFIKPKDEKQTIVITVKGPVTRERVDEWNAFIRQIKAKFGENFVAYTIEDFPNFPPPTPPNKP